MPTQEFKLVQGEEIIWVKRSSFFVFCCSLLGLAVAFYSIFLIFNYADIHYKYLNWIIISIGGLVSFILLLGWISTKYLLTNRKIAKHFGVFGRKCEEIALEDVQGIDLSQNFWGMIFGYGTIRIEAAGNNNFITIDSIQAVHKIKKQISDLAA